jgi:transcriptional regulator with XRE-family HTH domain|tara:strand:+ start:1585 stop:1920 length:336 start_codon:yes stop_codon:yes gene_type:complete
MNTNAEIGSRMRALRKSNGMTLREASAAILEKYDVEMSFSYIGDLERGDKRWFWEHIAMFCDLYEVPTSLATDKSIPLAHVEQIGQILEELSELPGQKYEAVLQVVRAMKP